MNSSEDIAEVEEYCESCKYANDIGGGELVCRRYPPVVVGRVSDDPGWLSAADCRQPTVTPDDTCGEWKLQSS